MALFGLKSFSLNKLEIASFTVKENETITKEMIEDIVKKANTTIDKNEDGHYDAVSALQKTSNLLIA